MRLRITSKQNRLIQILMEKLTPEKYFVNSTIEKLNTLSSGWINGDEEDIYREIESVDIVNHSLKIAIEIKDNSLVEISTPNFSFSSDYSITSKRYQRHIESANKKFRNYSNYESIVLIRHLTRDGKNDFAYLLGGFITVTPTGRISNSERNISRHSESCSIFAFLNPDYSNELFAYRNPDSARKSDKVINILKGLYKNFDEITQEDLWSVN